jgi:hypothetical protein
MIAEPKFVPTSAGLLMILTVVVVSITPLPLGWTYWLPTPAGEALRVQEARSITHFHSCERSETHSSWQAIAAHPNGPAWFGAVVREARTPAARLYGLAGLALTAPAILDSVVAELPAGWASDSVAVYRSSFEPAVVLPLDTLLHGAWIDTLVEFLADSTPRGYCRAG